MTGRAATDLRALFTTADARLRGLTPSALRWGERTGRYRRVQRGVYALGPHDPDDLDRARARVMASNGVASGRLAGVLHGLDAVDLAGPPARSRRAVTSAAVVEVAGISCTNGIRTVLDLAATLDDDRWDQALESALRARLTTIGAIERVLPQLSKARTPGVARIKRVLGRRPPGAPATESLLETLMLQLARGVAGLGEPERQHSVRDDSGDVIARVDLAWPTLGLFLELDGQHHVGQPVHDARRETAVVAATGWLPGRFTWREVVRLPRTTTRRLGALARQARRRHSDGFRRFPAAKAS